MFGRIVFGDDAEARARDGRSPSDWRTALAPRARSEPDRALRAPQFTLPKWNVAIELKVLWGRSYFLSSIKICQRFMLSCFRIPRSSQGSFFIFSLTSFSSSALKIKREPPSSTKGPPIKMEPSATSRSINSACSSQNGCSRVPFDKSRFGPAEEIITNVFFITGKPQASVHPVQPRMFH
jgi:hypothetical protein